MSKMRKKYYEDFKKKVVKPSYVTPKTVKDLSADFGVNPILIYRWRKIYTGQGEKTKLAEQENALCRLQLENAELKIENEVLKKSRVFLGLANRVITFGVKFFLHTQKEIRSLTQFSDWRGSALNNLCIYR